MSYINRASAPPVCSQGYRILGHNTPEALSLGRLVHPEDGISNKILYDGEKHIVVFGPNGSGKGTRICLPNALGIRGKRSMVFVDPKGELAAVSAPYRRTLGRVVILNPFGLLTDIPGYEDLESCGFNPLLSLDPKSPSFNSDAAAFAAACCPVADKDPYWDLSARSLTAACTMFTVLEAHGLIEPWPINGKLPLVNGVPTIARVRELLCQASSEGNPRLDMPPVGLPALALEMAKAASAGLKNKAGQFTDWSKDIKSVARVAMQHTECFDDDPMAADLAKGSFDFRDLKRETVTVYLILHPDQMERHAKWLRIILTMALLPNMKPRAPGESRILFCIDEFFALGRLEIIQTVWALVRGAGIQLMPILQDLGQLKTLYPTMWQTFVGMAGVVMSFAPGSDTDTAEWLSKRCGDVTRQTKAFNLTTGDSGGTSSGHSSAGQGGYSSGSNSGWSVSSSKTYTPVKVPLITPHQLMGLHPGYMVVFLGGMSHVIPTYAPAYYHVDTYRERDRENPYFPDATRHYRF